MASTGTVKNGKISSSSDVDYYKVTLAAGKTLTVDLRPPSDKDYDVEIYNPGTTKVASGITRGAGALERVTYTAPAAATVYIKVLGYSSAYSGTVNYYLKASW